MKKTPSLCILVFMFLFFSGTAMLLPAVPARGADTFLMRETFVLDPITVTENLNAEELNSSSAVVVEKNRSNNVADFLVRDPEISFKRKAAFGDSSDIISIRGMESKRIMLNLDGRNISSTGIMGGNYIDFGTIPLDNIERIEVIKGGSSVEYGNTALGGVINAYTKRPAEKAAVNLYATMGGWDKADDFYNIRGSYAQKFGPFGLSVGASQQKARAFLRNNDYESLHVNPKLYLELPWQGEIIAGYNYSDTDRGLIRSNRKDGNPASDNDPSVPGFGDKVDSKYPLASGEYFAGGAPTPSMNVIGDGAHWVKKRHLMDLTYKQELGESGWLELMAYKNHETRREKNYADVAARMQLSGGPPSGRFDPALTRDGDLVLDRKITVDDSYGYKAKGGLTLGDHELMAGVDYKIMRSGKTVVNHIDRNYNKHGANGWTGVMDNSEGESPAYVAGAFAADKFFITDNLILDIGLRFDSYKHSPKELDKTYEDWAVSPKAMLSWEFAERQSASLAVYQNYRTPSMPELYWNSQAASPDRTSNVPYLEGRYLKPETARGVDLAYKYGFEKGGFAKLAAFYYNIENYILHKAVYVDRPPGNQNWAAYNTDAQIYGATLSASYPVLDSLSVQGALSWQDSKKENDPSDPNGVLEKLEYIPDWKGTVGFSWEIVENLALDAALTYVGQRSYYVNTASLHKGTLKDYATLGASLRYKFMEHTTLEIYADNITDTDYEESWGYPAMGFNAGMSIKWEM